MSGHRERTQSSNREAGDVYAAAVTYLLGHGWRREELGSGWWWKEGFEEAEFGRALDQQLVHDGIDMRKALIGEPEEFWG